MKYIAWRVSAGLYIVWGLLHVALGASMLAAAGYPRLEHQAESAMFFVCATLLGTQAIINACAMLRSRSALAYWLNLTILGIVDIAFVWLMVIPGHVDVLGGLSGPALWLLAAVASTFGRLHGTGRVTVIR